MARPSGKDGVQFGSPERGKDASSRASRGRMCLEAGCTTILSTYNASETCWLHTGPAYRHPLSRS
jgi:hypothetical protein